MVICDVLFARASKLAQPVLAASFEGLQSLATIRANALDGLPAHRMESIRAALLALIAASRRAQRDSSNGELKFLIGASSSDSPQVRSVARDVVFGLQEWNLQLIETFSQSVCVALDSLDIKWALMRREALPFRLATVGAAALISSDHQSALHLLSSLRADTLVLLLRCGLPGDMLLQDSVDRCRALIGDGGEAIKVRSLSLSLPLSLPPSLPAALLRFV